MEKRTMKSRNDCKTLFKFSLGRYKYTTYFIPSFAEGVLYEEVATHCRAIAKKHFGSVPDYQILAKVPTKNPKLTTLVHHRNTMQPVAFTSAVVFTAINRRCLHLGLTVIDESERGNRICSILNSVSALAFVYRYKHFGFYVTNVSMSPAILHTVGKYWFKAYPYFANANPEHEITAVAHEFAEGMRDEVHILPSAKFCDSTFVFRCGNEGNPFHLPDGGTPARCEEVQEYYARRMQSAQGDVVLQVGYASPISVFYGHFLANLFRRSKNTAAQRPLSEVPSRRLW